MAHPDWNLSIQLGEQIELRTVQMHHSVAILSSTSRCNTPAELVRQQLHPIADAQHGHTCIENPGWGHRSSIVIHAVRPAAQDNPDDILIV